MDIPYELYEEILLGLSYDDIIKLSLVNKNLNTIRETTWKKLLYRDFLIQDKDSYYSYIKLHRMLNYFSVFPIITMKALQGLMTLSEVDWSKIVKEYNLNKHYHHYRILDLSIIKMTFDTETLYDSIVEINEINTKINEIIEHGCYHILKLSTIPTLIFIHGKPVVVKYDIDYGFKLVNILGQRDIFCFHLLGIISDYIHQLL